MKKISFFLTLILGLGLNTTIAQIKNEKTITVAINGNCGMCKKTIDSNGSEPKISKVNWDIDSKKAEITYDSTKTSEETILKKIALAGYDNAKFRAPDDVYENLHECCKYDREHQIAKKGPHADSKDHKDMNHGKHEVQKNGLDAVFTNYLSVKDALVATDSKSAADAAKKLASEIKKVDMAGLGEAEHQTWMKVKTELEKSALQISSASNIENQRSSFIGLSDLIYKLAKDSETEIELYYQFCPMANNNKGAYWISKENSVKNPYYGSKMMTCGEVKEKI